MRTIKISRAQGKSDTDISTNPFTGRYERLIITPFSLGQGKNSEEFLTDLFSITKC